MFLDCIVLLVIIININLVNSNLIVLRVILHVLFLFKISTLIYSGFFSASICVNMALLQYDHGFCSRDAVHIWR